MNVIKERIYPAVDKPQPRPQRVTVVNEDGTGTGRVGEIQGFASTEDYTYAILLLPDGTFKEYALKLLRVLNEDGNQPVGVMTDET